MVNVAFPLSTKETPGITDRHETLVPLYWALAGMVRVSTVVSSAVAFPAFLLFISFDPSPSNRVPLTFQPMAPPLVSHVNTADWFT